MNATTTLDALPAEMDALKRLQAETAVELDALLPAVLDRALKGTLDNALVSFWSDCSLPFVYRFGKQLTT